MNYKSDTNRDLLVCSKMKVLSTSDIQSKPNDEIVAAFVSVLSCSEDEATFFLESSLWNLETAILLWLESDPSVQNKRSRNESSNDFTRSESLMNDMKNGLNDLNRSESLANDLIQISETSGKPKYQHIQLVIPDLPQEWSAWVHAHIGSVYFLNKHTGVVQLKVPPGFADDETFNVAKGNSSGANGVGVLKLVGQSKL